MKMETRIAISNIRYYKNRNLLIGIAICLTSFLLFLVPTIAYDVVQADFAAVNEVYPTWHALFRDVDDDTINKLANHHNVSRYGVRSDAGIVTNEDRDMILMYMDYEAIDLYRLRLDEGRMPQEANEIVVSKGVLDVLSIDASIGDTITLPYQVYQDEGLGYAREGKFVITGLIADRDESSEEQVYTAFISKQFLDHEMQKQDIRYRFLFQVAVDENDDTDQIKERIHQLAEQFHLEEGQIGINGEYLMANYVDPAIRPAVIIIMLIIVFAGVITIYSIYYVNMPNRIQEFGRLKSIGATKKQVKKIVLLEGMGVTCIALPVGLVVGTILTKVILMILFHSNRNENALMDVAKKLIDQGRITFFSIPLYLLTIVITFLTVYISLRKPMSIASKISEIDAMRYELDPVVKRRTKKKERKSFLEVNILRLSQIYLFGNKKNSVVTIVSMSITGIFIIVIATILSCANPRESADDSILGQYRMCIDVETGNKEHPEKEWDQVILNNPLNDTLKQEIEQIEGIQSVSYFNAIRTESDYFADDQQSIGGVPKEYEQKLLDGIIKGHVTIEELETSNRIIVDKNLLHWYPKIKIGDKIRLQVVDGTKNNSIEVEVAAIGDYPIGFSNYNYLLTTYDKVKTFCHGNANEVFQIFADKDYEENTYQKLQALVQDQKLLQMDSWKAHYEEWKSGIMLVSISCYAFLGIISGICVMNMLNTMINSVQVRKKEIGMMQAIGMTDQQLVRMLQQEGMFYTIGTLVLSIGLGSLIGYPIYLKAKWTGLFNISKYHYPWKAVLIITVVLVLLQMILSFALGKMVRKESIIERVRFSE